MKYIVADFQNFDFTDGYDVVLSSLALHHLVTDADKRDFYRRIYESLNSGGVFYNADVVLASSDFLQSVYMDEWRRFISHAIPREEIEGKWIPKYQEEDLFEQIFLSYSGFITPIAEEEYQETR
jgi:tRNA (cmo5U34)-methyltransferase